MNLGNSNLEQKMRRMIEKSILTLPDRNFEDRVMQKVSLAHTLKIQRNKSLKLSWLFLAISTISFPGGFIIFMRQSDYSFVPIIGNALKTPGQVFVPAAMLIFAIILLIQIDNLLKLTFRVKVYY
jgi:hypothetical protein